MIFDTDVIIWIERGHRQAADLVNREAKRLISQQTYLELLQGASNRLQQKRSKAFLAEMEFEILPLSEAIGHRAATYIEQYALSHGLLAGDALIAATAAEHGQTLCTSNAKHFRAIKELKLKVFKP